jgi:hypothetical protein
MPTYPSSLYKGVAPSSLGSNVTGSMTVSNVARYQELQDITIAPGSGTNDTTTLAFNSAGKYPTDTNFGSEIVTNRTRTKDDFDTAVSRLTTVLGAYTTAIGACSDAEKKIAPSFTGNSYFNLQSKIEKVTFELNRMVDDLTGLGAEASTSNLQSTARYPSSLNRFTNTAGGI